MSELQDDPLSRIPDGSYITGAELKAVFGEAERQLGNASIRWAATVRGLDPLTDKETLAEVRAEGAYLDGELSMLEDIRAAFIEKCTNIDNNQNM